MYTYYIFRALDVHSIVVSFYAIHKVLYRNTRLMKRILYDTSPRIITNINH